jgi:hypothetical protein
MTLLKLESTPGPVNATSHSQKVHSVHSAPSSCANIIWRRLFLDERIKMSITCFKPQRDTTFFFCVHIWHQLVSELISKISFPLSSVTYITCYFLSRLFPLNFQTKILYTSVVSHACCMTHQAHPSNNIRRKVKYFQLPAYVIFFTLLLLPLSGVQTFFSVF